MLRHLRGSKGWITEAENTGYSPLTYQDEANITQLGISMTSVSKVLRDRLTEVSDEPLTRAQVMEIVGPFIKRAA